MTTIQINHKQLNAYNKIVRVNRLVSDLEISLLPSINDLSLLNLNVDDDP